MTLIYNLKNVNGVISIVACFWLINFLHFQDASASAVYKASKNLGAAGREASDSGKVIPHDKGIQRQFFYLVIFKLKSKTNIYK